MANSVSVSESVSLSEPSGCDFPKTARPLDAAVDPGACRTFLQRIGSLTTIIPGARSQPDGLRAHRIPLTSPLPVPDLLGAEQGSPPPDRGPTLEWPYPDWQREQAAEN